MGVHGWSCQTDELKERLARALADMENLRERTARAQDQSRQFAIQVRCLMTSQDRCSWALMLVKSAHALWAAVGCIACTTGLLALGFDQPADRWFSCRHAVFSHPGYNISRRRSGCRMSNRLSQDGALLRCRAS